MLPLTSDTVDPITEHDSHKPLAFQVKLFRNSIIIVILLIVLAFLGVLYTLLISSPRQLQQSANALEAEFDVDSVLDFVHQITKLGPHPFGSPAQREHVLPYVFNEAIPSVVNLARSLNWEAGQSVICSDGTAMIEGAPYAYYNVCNGVLSFAPPGISLDSPGIVLSAHIDSIFWAPGAFDNAINAGIALELSRGILKHSSNLDSFKHPIHIILGDAEEIGLFTSHVAINTMPEKLGVVINLEAVGWGGKSVLFRWTPEHQSSLLKHVRKASDVLVAGIATDIFASGIIGSMTDYYYYSTVCPVLDFAFVEKTERYHTYFDRYPQDKKEEEEMKRSAADTLVNLYQIVESIASEDELDFDSGSGSWFILPVPGIVILVFPAVFTNTFLLVGFIFLVFVVIRKDYSLKREVKNPDLNWFLVVGFVIGQLLIPIILCAFFGFILRAVNSMSLHAFPVVATSMFFLLTTSGLFLLILCCSTVPMIVFFYVF
ncbi:hypothetical protein GEMRC1_002358 [Eukaryota sp. GEM-RC1]